MIGKTISHYKIVDKLGEGGMGQVFLADDTSLDRKVALKFLPENLQQDPTARKRFLREAKSAAALDHPYICNIFQIGEEDDTAFIVMEYVILQYVPDRYCFKLRDTSASHKVFSHQMLHGVCHSCKIVPMHPIFCSDQHHQYRSTAGKTPPDLCDVISQPCH